MWLLTFAGLFWLEKSPVPWPGLVPDPTPAAPLESRPSFHANFVNEGTLASLVHAATAIIDPDGRLRCYWYGGSREGASDVEIYTAVFDREADAWIGHHSVFDRQTVTRATGSYVRKLGNAVAVTRSEGEVWLFYVTVPIGGWAYSAINLAKSLDGGTTFVTHKRLIASPFLNRSMIVRSPTWPYDDGTLALPAHYEVQNKHAEILRLDDTGNVIGKQRINGDMPSLQPQLLVDEQLTVAVMRNGVYADAGRRVLIATSKDRGRSWSQTRETGIANPNAAVAGLRSAQGYLFVYNNHEEKRDQLSLGFASEADGAWQELHLLEYEEDTRKHEYRFSYPWFVRHDGNYHLFYTWNRKRIKHVVFNDAWLAQKIEALNG